MRRRVLIVTDRRILPVRAGNHARILGLLRGLRELGWRTTLIAPDGQGCREIEGEVDGLVRVRARPFSSGEISRFDIRPFRRAVASMATRIRPAAAIAEYAWMAPALGPLPRRVIRLVDCHDVLHERTRRFESAGLDPWVRCTAAQERRLLAHADVLLAIQHREAAVLQRLLPSRRVVCLLPSVELAADPENTPDCDPVALSVGAGHAGNEGILRFATEVWPTVVPDRADVLLRVVGAIGRERPPLARVEWLPEVEDLARCYRSAAVVVCPVEIGTGAKIKLLEALRYGKATVATPAAVEGLPPPERPAWLVAGSLARCGEAVSLLLDSQDRRSELSEGAFAYGERHLSPTRLLADLRSVLPGLAARLARHLA